MDIRYVLVCLFAGIALSLQLFVAFRDIPYHKEVQHFKVSMMLMVICLLILFGVFLEMEKL